MPLLPTPVLAASPQGQDLPVAPLVWGWEMWIPEHTPLCPMASGDSCPPTHTPSLSQPARTHFMTQGQVQLYGKTAPHTAGNTSVKHGGSQVPGAFSPRKQGPRVQTYLWPVLALPQNSRAKEMGQRQRRSKRPTSWRKFADPAREERSPHQLLSLSGVTSLNPRT